VNLRGLGQHINDGFHARKGYSFLLESLLYSRALRRLALHRYRWCFKLTNDTEKTPGEVAEWSIVLDSKSSELKGSEGSNPSLSASNRNKPLISRAFSFSAFPTHRHDIEEDWRVIESAQRARLWHAGLHVTCVWRVDVGMADHFPHSLHHDRHIAVGSTPPRPGEALSR
jgi:hypothetical protein